MPSKKPKFFATPAGFRAWLKAHHSTHKELLVGFYKKGTGQPSITWPESVDEALCFGWIDGRKDPYDAISWVQNFSPRRARSGWSKINTGHADRLIKAGKMTPAGLAQIEAAKADGRWDAAYSSPAANAIPEDFLEALAKNKRAKAFFDTLTKANLYSIAYRLQTAKKPETRVARMKTILQMMKDGKKFH